MPAATARRVLSRRGPLPPNSLPPYGGSLPVGRLPYGPPAGLVSGSTSTPHFERRA